jgi:integrase
MKSEISAKIYLRKSRISDKGTYPVYLILSQNRKVKWISLNIETRPDHWDDEKGLPNRKHPLYNEVKTFLEKKKADISNILWNSKNLDKPLTIDQMVNKLNLGTANKGSDVFKFFDQTYQRLIDTGRIGYAKVFLETKRQLVNFTGKKELSFYDLNFQFLTLWEEWILKRGVSLNSCFVFVRTLKTLLNNARKEEIVDEFYNPFKDYSFLKFRKISPRKRAISKFDIDNLKALNFEPDTSLFKTRLYYLFSYYCRGINFRDMAYLKWSDITDNCIRYERLKTKKVYIIRLEPEPLEILNHFKKFQSGKHSFIFPILSNIHETPLQQDYRIKKIQKIVNKDLKEIARFLNITDDLTFYSARHTFATVSKKAGVPTAKISEALGHDTERTTNIYLDSFEQEDLDNAFKGIL